VEAWEVLLPRALEILEGVGPDTFWTMGGGTVLMLRHNHRASKDVDIFFRDPQPLGYVNPRLGGAAERMTSQYEESSGHVAKKMWHRGHEAKARDLFDLSLVIERCPNEMMQAAEYFLRNRDAFLESLRTRRSIVKAQFESIDVRDYRPGFEDCIDRVSAFLNALGESPEGDVPAPG